MEVYGGVTASIGSTSNVTCNGANDGTATVTANGTAPYSYSWSNGSTTATNNGLAAGTYNVTVTDANGCSATAQTTITAPNALSTTIQTSQATCSGSLADGTINALMTGGTSPYTYAWSNGASTQMASNLTAGTYSVTITDANGCSTTGSATIATMCCNVTSAGVIAGAQSSCGSFNPTAITSTSLPSGGVGAVEYLWLQSNTLVPNTVGNPYWTPISNSNAPTYNPGVLTQTTYFIRCSRTGTCTFYAGESNVITMEVNNGITAMVVYENDVTCNGSATGSAKVKATSGKSPFSYAWSNGETDAIANNLAAGNYSVTVTDANGCEANIQVVITEPNAIHVSSVVTDNSCNSGNVDCDFSLSGYVNGQVMTGAYPNEGFTITSVANSGSLHDLIIFNSDLSGTRDSDLEVDLGNLLIFPENSVDNNNDGNYDLPDDTRYGGTITFTFTNTKAVTSFDFIDKDDGPVGTAKAYDVNNNLIVSKNIVNMGDASIQTILMNATGVKKLVIYYYNSGALGNFKFDCEGADLCDGMIDLTVNGGIAPYTYNWSNGATTQNIKNVCVGSYLVTITDAAGCSKIESVDVDEPTSINGSMTGYNATSSNNCNGYININTVSGGSGSYSYSWSNGATTKNVSSLCAGKYTVTVTDTHGCTATGGLTLKTGGGVCTQSNSRGQNDDDGIKVKSGVNENEVSPISTTLYPNPSNGKFTLEFSTRYSGNLTIVLYDMAGNSVDVLYDAYMVENEISILKYDSDKLSRGVYTIAMTSNGKVTYERLIIQ